METLERVLSKWADYLLYDLLGISLESSFGVTVHYFLVTFTVLILLVILVTYLMGTIVSYLPMEKVKNYLEKHKHSGFGNIAASILGAVTPFCSCSSIPLFVGMMQARMPLGIALSFLITSPLVNEIAIALFWATYGWKVTLVYVVSGIVLGVLGGIILEKLGMEHHIAVWLKNLGKPVGESQTRNKTFGERLPKIHADASQTIRKLAPYVFFGIVIGALVHGYVPESFFEEYISKSNPLAVPLAVVLSIPLYIDAVGILPVLESLVGKGVPLGTGMAFMMGSIGLSLPEAMLLKKVMQKRLIIAFFATIATGMILSGWLFNLLF
ncbi:uncharacterized membrane protein YraQ (UPF0718 family) [Algoriphagus sp. 4150]|uniref:permease n=1 Tax=Algoriphagus sp. 4150 TaxID=2817756 RepID=UPI002866E36C|nr:permease [Algoriphagus sp. 4150]MDR7130914.1 uncharacterized membrane protein YraQ (UPF0718 family) [Algoriphagus sp. 4150]